MKPLRFLPFLILVTAALPTRGDFEKGGDAGADAAEAVGEDASGEAEVAKVNPGTPSLVGVWRLEAVKGEDISEREKAMTVEFKADGTVLRKKGERELPGNYEVSEDGKTVILTTGDPERKRTLEVTRLDGNTFSFRDGDEEVTLKRVGAERDAPAEDTPPAAPGEAGLVVGRWQLSSVAGEDFSDADKAMVIEFKADGTISRSKGESKKNGTYTISEDGRSLSLIREGSDDKEVMDLITLSETTLAFDDKGTRVVLTRIVEDDTPDLPADNGGDSGASRSSEGSAENR